MKKILVINGQHSAAKTAAAIDFHLFIFNISKPSSGSLSKGGPKILNYCVPINSSCSLSSRMLSINNKVFSHIWESILVGSTIAKVPPQGTWHWLTSHGIWPYLSRLFPLIPQHMLFELDLSLLPVKYRSVDNMICSIACIICIPLLDLHLQIYQLQHCEPKQLSWSTEEEIGF